MRSICEFADVMARGPFPSEERAGGSLPIKDSLYNMIFEYLLFKEQQHSTIRYPQDTFQKQMMKPRKMLPSPTFSPG